MRHFLTLIAVLAIFGLAGCGSTLPKVTSFKMDIQQGNVVTSKMLLKLRPGMTKKQVRYIMGTPLIEDSFHNNRWDYFYQLRKAGKIISQRRVILDFDQELLARVRGDVVPEGTPGADTGEQMLSESEIKPEEKSTLDKLKFWKKDEAVAEEVKPAEAKSTEVLEPVAVPSALSEVEAPPTTDVEGAVDAVETGEAVEDGTIENTEEPASILAVPIPLEPSVDATPTLLHEVTIPEVEIAEDTASEIAAPDVATEMPSIDAATPEIEVPEAVMLKPETATVEPASLVPAEVMPMTQDINQSDKMIFRLDRSLDAERLEQASIPKPAAPVLEDAVQKESVVNEDVTPIQDEPNYFERILEKIGF